MSVSKSLVKELTEAGGGKAQRLTPVAAAGIDCALLRAYEMCGHLLGASFWQRNVPAVVGIVGQAGTEEVINNLTRGYGMPVIHALQVYLDLGVIGPEIPDGSEAMREAFITAEMSVSVADKLARSVSKASKMMGYAIMFAIMRRSGRNLQERFLVHAAHNLRVLSGHDETPLGRILTSLAYLRSVKAIFGRRSSKFMIVSEFVCALVNYIINSEDLWANTESTHVASKLACLLPAIKSIARNNMRGLALSVLGCGSLWFLLWRYSRATRVIRVPPVQSPSALLDALRAVEMVAHLSALPHSRVILGGVDLPADLNGATEHACAPVCDCGNEGLAIVATNDAGFAAQYATPYVMTASTSPMDSSATVGHTKVSFVPVRTIPHGVGKLYLGIGTLQKSLEIHRDTPLSYVADEGTVDYDPKRGEFVFRSSYGEDRVPAAVIGKCATTLADMKRGPKFYSTVRAYTLGQLASVKCAARHPVLIVKYVIYMCDFQAATLTSSVIEGDPVEYGYVDQFLTRARLYVSRDIIAAIDMCLSKFVQAHPTSRFVFPWKWQEVHLQNYEMLTHMVHCTPCEPRRILNQPFPPPLSGAHAGADNGDEPRPGDDATKCDIVGGDTCVGVGAEGDAPACGAGGSREHDPGEGSASVPHGSEGIRGDDYGAFGFSGVSDSPPKPDEPSVGTASQSGGNTSRWLGSSGGPVPPRKTDTVPHARRGNEEDDNDYRFGEDFEPLIVSFKVADAGTNVADSSGYVNVVWDEGGILCEVPGLGSGQFGPGLLQTAYGVRPTESDFTDHVKEAYSLYVEGRRLGPGRRSPVVRDLSAFMRLLRQCGTRHNSAARKVRSVIVGLPADDNAAPLVVGVVPSTGSGEPTVDGRANTETVRGVGIAVPTRPGRHTQNSPTRPRRVWYQPSARKRGEELHQSRDHRPKYRPTKYFATRCFTNGSAGTGDSVDGRSGPQLPVHGEGANARGEGSET